MRVVAGTAGGRTLVCPPGRAIRPTSDLVREAIFNSLYSLGGVEGWTIADLYAGTGALGIEALSRGAARCTFVERDRVARAAIDENLETLGFVDRATVVSGDVGLIAPTLGPLDLVLADPPYGFDGFAELLASLDAPRAVLEADHEPALGDGWTIRRSRSYRSTVVVVAERAAPAAGHTERVGGW